MTAEEQIAYRPGRGALTPWGPADCRTMITDGLDFYSTPSHGGYRVSGAMLKRIPAAARAATWRKLGEQGWYEEDEDWAIVAFCIPEAFTREEWAAACRTLNRPGGLWDACGTALAAGVRPC